VTMLAALQALVFFANSGMIMSQECFDDVPLIIIVR
jgi:hypothetical protein